MVSQTRSRDPNWAQSYHNYGAGDRVLQDIIKLYANMPTDVEFLETGSHSPGQVVRHKLTDIDAVIKRLDQPSLPGESIRAISVKSLSSELLQLLGVFFQMERDLWTSRLYACDREYFAAPLPERGAKHFSHFHLACVDFFRATQRTPPEFLTSRKINHTTRLVSLLDSRPVAERTTPRQPRMYVVRRITGHLRRDENMWTFLYLCDPFIGFDEAHYVRDTMGDALSNSQDWVSECIHSNIAEAYALSICKDGFGLTAKILRDIKSSWKLLLTEFETFLEDINETYEDEEFIRSAGFIHRQYLISIDYFQRQLFYHDRYLNYLTGSIMNREAHVGADFFKNELVQESNAMKVVELRLNALRLRTTTVLDMILSLNSIKQTQLQREDTKISLNQGESIRKLTLVNMAFLPPSFVASTFGMNTIQTQGLQIWIFVLTAALFCLTTMGLVLLRIVPVDTEKATDQSNIPRNSVGRTLTSWGMPRWKGGFRIKQAMRDPETGILGEGKDIKSQ